LAAAIAESISEKETVNNPPKATETEDTSPFGTHSSAWPFLIV
jgi:hypothetical protein